VPRALPAGLIRGLAVVALLPWATVGRAVADESHALRHEAAEATDGDSSAGDTWTDRLRRAAEAMEWSDALVRHDWRIQRRPHSDRWRVLDPADKVVCSGSFDECRKAFSGLETVGTVPPVEGPTVILLHGLGEGRGSMSPLASYLREHHGGTVMSFGYASPRAGIDDHARSLADVIAGIPAADRISFVAHSLGNLVVRRWMADADEADRRRIHRMVMLGAPNQGSELARKVSQVWVLSKLSSGAARDLVLDWPRVSRDLAVPECPFGIIAGGTGDDIGYSTLLEGDDDAVVRVAETRLEGADDFLLLPVRHAFMMRDPAVQEATAAFLGSGRFAAGDEKAAGASAPHGRTGAP
jgi:pimeloyl-ACP methyl ester carboxylesterase